MSRTELQPKQAISQPCAQSANPHQRSCDSLGSCQSRLPASKGCTWAASSATRLAGHAFAPGVVTVHPSSRLAGLRKVCRKAYTVARVTLLAGLLASAIFLVVGACTDANPSEAQVAETETDEDPSFTLIEARRDTLARKICIAELGPGTQAIWTVDGDLVCRPAAVTAEGGDQ